jgi:hypothetical protein
MKLQEFLDAASHRICGGSEFGWNCFPNSQYADISDIDGKEIGGCVFSTVDQTVYEAAVHVEEDDAAFRWADGTWTHAAAEEAAERGVDINIAYDSVRYIDIADAEEFLQLVSSIVHKTYVHSKPAVILEPPLAELEAALAERGMYLPSEPPHLGPGMAWPFPPSHAMSDDDEEFLENILDAESLVEEEKLGSTLNALLDEIAREEAEEDYEMPSDELELTKSFVPRNEYQVTITMKHLLDVKAASMEEAATIARNFAQSLKPGSKEWPDGLCWNDTYVSKEAVSRRLKTTDYDEDAFRSPPSSTVLDPIKIMSQKQMLSDGYDY